MHPFSTLYSKPQIYKKFEAVSPISCFFSGRLVKIPPFLGKEARNSVVFTISIRPAVVPILLAT